MKQIKYPYKNSYQYIVKYCNENGLEIIAYSLMALVVLDLIFNFI